MVNDLVAVGARRVLGVGAEGVGEGGDMTGAAVVVATLKAAALCKVKQNIVRKLTQENVKYFGNILRFTG